MALLLRCCWLEALSILYKFKHQSLVTFPDSPGDLKAGAGLESGRRPQRRLLSSSSALRDCPADSPVGLCAVPRCSFMFHELTLTQQGTRGCCHDPRLLSPVLFSPQRLAPVEAPAACQCACHCYCGFR